MVCVLPNDIMYTFHIGIDKYVRHLIVLNYFDSIPPYLTFLTRSHRISLFITLLQHISIKTTLGTRWDIFCLYKSIELDSSESEVEVNLSNDFGSFEGKFEGETRVIQSLSTGLGSRVMIEEAKTIANIIELGMKYCFEDMTEIIYQFVYRDICLDEPSQPSIQDTPIATKTSKDRKINSYNSQFSDIKSPFYVQKQRIQLPIVVSTQFDSVMKNYHQYLLKLAYVDWQVYLSYHQLSSLSKYSTNQVISLDFDKLHELLGSEGVKRLVSVQYLFIHYVVYDIYVTSHVHPSKKLQAQFPWIDETSRISSNHDISIDKPSNKNMTVLLSSEKYLDYDSDAVDRRNQACQSQPQSTSNTSALLIIHQINSFMIQLYSENHGNGSKLMMIQTLLLSYVLPYPTLSGGSNTDGSAQGMLASYSQSIAKLLLSLDLVSWVYGELLKDTQQKDFQLFQRDVNNISS